MAIKKIQCKLDAEEELNMLIQKSVQEAADQDTNPSNPTPKSQPRKALIAGASPFIPGNPGKSYAPFQELLGIKKILGKH